MVGAVACPRDSGEIVVDVDEVVAEGLTSVMVYAPMAAMARSPAIITIAGSPTWISSRSSASPRIAFLFHGRAYSRAVPAR